LSKDARQLFEEHFGPLDQVVPISGHKFVLLNAPGLVEEDYRRHAHGKTYDQWTPLPGGVKSLMSTSDQENDHAPQPIILLTHIPLSRPSGKSCGPLREKGSIRAGAGYGYQVMLGKETTEFLLKTLHPSAIFSHEIPDSGLSTRTSPIIREVTIKSFLPSRHIRRPGFQLLSLIPPSSGAPTEPTLADAPCHLPDTLGIFHSVYLPCLVVTSIVLLYLGISPSRHRRRLSTLSSVSVERGRPSSESGSAIWSSLWSTWSSRKSRVKTSPTGSLSLPARIPSTKAIPSYRASPICTPQGSPLLSPITLFPPEDEAEAEDPMSPSHYTLRRDPHHHGSSGWSEENEDDQERGHTGLAVPRRRTAQYILPPPSSQHRRNE
ncbi:hypothetical protein BU15DRAFT_41475, partial [Melanogaster broomeanus]